MAGKKGRSGRPSNKTYEHLEDLLSKAWSAGSRLAAVRKLAEMAEAGEVKALKRRNAAGEFTNQRVGR